MTGLWGAPAGMGPAGANSGQNRATPAPALPTTPYHHYLQPTVCWVIALQECHLPSRPKGVCGALMSSYPGRYSVVTASHIVFRVDTKIPAGGGAGGNAGAGGDGRVAGGSLQRGRECPAFPRLPAGQDGVSHFPPVQPLAPC